MTFITGQAIRIHRTIAEAPLSPEDSIARFERYGPTGMVYATREDGSDAVAFASECAPIGRVITVAKRLPEPVGTLPVKKTGGFRLQRSHSKSKHKDGISYAELADLAGVTVNVVKKAVIAGRLIARKLGYRSAIIEHAEAARWLKVRAAR